MTWRDDLRRVAIDGKQLIGASFRGVPFLVDSAERGGGRRAVVHEFPMRDDPYVEDLGRKARTFRIDGYVLGDDYLTKKNALLSALEDFEGPGELVHPYHGMKSAICTNLSVRETKSEGGIAVFAIEFAEAPAQVPVPLEEVDSTEQVSASATAAATAADAELAEDFDAGGLPAFALESAETALTKAADALSAKLAPIITETQELAQFNSRITIMVAEAASLVRTPADVMSSFREAITGLTSTIAAAPGAVMDGLIDAYLEDLGTPVIATTATRQRELDNQDALIAALRRVMAVEAARLAPRVPYSSIEEAIAARDAVGEVLDEQAALAGDTAYPAIVELRSQVLRAVPGGRAFASIVPVTRSVAIPTILLAYQLYGSVDREADIIARNGIAHPGFAVGEMKVLSDG